MKSKKICICYGTSNGATAKAATMIKEKLSSETNNIQIDVFNLYESGSPDWKKYDFLVLGSPTYYNGQLQDDWSQTVLNTAPNELENKQVALFGLGDQESYCFTFVDSLGHLAHWLLKECQAKLAGYWPVQNYRKYEKLNCNHLDESEFIIPPHLTSYSFECSAALTTHQNQPAFYGLALDQYSQNEFTNARISCWCENLIIDWNLNEYNKFNLL